MPIYTVHGPVARGAATPSADAIVFVRDGFTWPALIFGPFWLIWHRLWWALLGYGVVMIAAGIAMSKLGLASDTRLIVNLLISLLMGLEGTSLRRWTLSRRRWKLLDLVAADDRDAAEQRFFARWTAAPIAPESHERGGPPPPRVPGFSAPPPNGIIGLFPEPQGALR